MSRLPRRPQPAQGRGASKVAKVFERANPKAYGRAEGNLTSVQRLAAIDRRAEAIKAKVRAHHEKYRESNIGRENTKLLAEWVSRNLKNDAPKAANTMLSEKTFAVEARRNVEARAVQRLSNVNKIKTRMQNAVIRNGPDIPLKQENSDTLKPRKSLTRTFNQ